MDSARRRLQDPTLARLIDGIAVDVGGEIRDIDEAEQHGIELAEPVRGVSSGKCQLAQERSKR